MTYQPTITLAQWCAYLPYEVVIDNDSLIEPRFKLTPRNFTYTLSFPERVKPLLRPMNDNVSNTPIMQRYRSVSGSKDLQWDSEKRLFISQTDGTSLPVTAIAYDVVQAFLAAHYDIFGLIEQGLAVLIE